jgi:hypothetical protein
VKKENEVSTAEKVRVLANLHTYVEGINALLGLQKRENKHKSLLEIGFSTDSEFHRKSHIHCK